MVAASPLANAESQYPAANFEPVIVTQDSALIAKHAESKPGSAVSSTNASSNASTTSKSAVTNSEPEVVAAKTEESSNLPMILVAAGLGAAVFWFMRKPAVATNTQAQSFESTASGTTGVARYVQELPGSGSAATTGVARYISALPPVTPPKPETGVAKYIKAIPAAEKPVAVSAPSGPTGVEKYISALPQPPKPAVDTGVAKYLKSQGLAA
jgi:hypothetical protein